MVAADEDDFVAVKLLASRTLPLLVELDHAGINIIEADGVFRVLATRLIKHGCCDLLPRKVPVFVRVRPSQRQSGVLFLLRHHLVPTEAERCLGIVDGGVVRRVVNVGFAEVFRHVLMLAISRLE